MSQYSFSLSSLLALFSQAFHRGISNKPRSFLQREKKPASA